MNRRRLIVIALIVVLAVAAFATRGFGLIPHRSDTELTLYGNVDIREVDMGFRVGGRIAGIGVEEGATAIFDSMYVHEFVHDGRHLLGFPCH